MDPEPSLEPVLTRPDEVPMSRVSVMRAEMACRRSSRAIWPASWRRRSTTSPRPYALSKRATEIMASILANRARWLLGGRAVCCLCRLRQACRRRWSLSISGCRGLLGPRERSAAGHGLPPQVRMRMNLFTARNMAKGSSLSAAGREYGRGQAGTPAWSDGRSECLEHSPLRHKLTAIRPTSRVSQFNSC